MKNSKKSKSLELEMVKNSDDWISALRHNLYTLAGLPGVSLHSLAETAGVNYDTFKSLLYGNAKNCKLDGVVKIARHFGLSLDGLVGAGTVSDRERALVLAFRKLPPAVAYFYEWSLLRIVANSGAEFCERSVPLLRPLLWSDGSLHLSAEVGVYNLEGLRADLSAKVKSALALPCDYYMPFYSPYHVLFLANDRAALRGEHSVVLIARQMFITEIRDGSCYSIRDGAFRCPLSSVDEVLGYIVGSCLLDEPVI